MCGIIGAFPPTNISLDYIKHRGPNASGTLNLKNVSLGHTRLSILDLSYNGLQPKWSRNGGVVTVYNGEIYNFQDLTKKQETSDTVALVEYLEKNGASADLSQLDGMYAFAAYFEDEEKLLLARDPAGIKPLYITFNESMNDLAFSSEVKGFFGVDWFKSRPNSDKAVQQDFLQYGYTFPRRFEINFRQKTNKITLIPTLLKNVYQIPPGYKLVISQNGNISQSKTKFKETLINNFDETFEQTVIDQTIADVEVGTQMSGGVDSSLVSYFYAKHFAKTSGFYVSVQYKNLNEDKWMKIAAERISKETNFKLHEIKLTSEEMLRVLPKVIWHLDEPAVRHPNAIGVYLLCEYVAQKTDIKVLMTGEGSDEMFGGYDWHDGKTLKDFDKSRRFFDYGGNKIVKEYLESYKKKNILKAQLAFDRSFYLPFLLARQDRMSMAHSIETRVPMLANVFWSMSTPKNPGKVEIKKMAAKIFGEEFAYRPKVGFGLPWEWLSDIKTSSRSLRWMHRFPRRMFLTESEKWAKHALSLWSEQYLYEGWKDKLYK